MSGNDTSDAFDGSPYITDSNQMVAFSVALITILAVRLEAIEKIRDPLIYWSVMLGAAGHLVSLLCGAWNTRVLAGDGDFDAYNFRDIWFSAADAVSHIALMFNSVYRTMVIISPKGGVWTLLTPACVVSVQVLLESLGLYYAYLWSQMYVDDPPLLGFSAVAFALIAFDSTVEILFFSLSQYKIISGLKVLTGKPVPFKHVVKFSTRCVCFAAATVTQYTDLAGYFSPSTTGSAAFVYQGPIVILLILLSDCNHIRDIVDHYNAPPKLSSAFSIKNLAIGD
ncbi:hypothetical protein DFJ73DRAFT_864637 [Zopfochytrium polystomum]|nr:hypothetical protein DFJ73DRAFT_864637 [Zopfochytrium polystomum]